MKKVLVLGSTGAMGRYLVPELLSLGYSVTGVSLDDAAVFPKEVRQIKGDAFDKDLLGKLLSEGYDGVVNFMNYYGPHFDEYYELFLNNTSHYIFLSTGRVYADEEIPVRETSPRLWDVSKDEKLLASNDYCIHKAKAENLLRSSDYKNWSIVRPATTFSTMRLQLVTLEMPNFIPRAMMGKKVILPIEAKDKPATLSWGGDVAKMIARILFKEEALCETYNVCSAENRTWEEIAEYYHELIGLEVIWVDKEDYLKIINPDVPDGVRWQLEYARLFHRITDNSKVLALTGLKQEELISMYDGLKKEIGNIPKDYVPFDTDIGLRMDEYIKQKGL